MLDRARSRRCGHIIAAAAERLRSTPLYRTLLSCRTLDAATIKLPRRMPYHVAMELPFTGRVMDAEEAKR